jgi:hypothetical protein
MLGITCRLLLAFMICLVAGCGQPGPPPVSAPTERPVTFPKAASVQLFYADTTKGSDRELAGPKLTDSQQVRLESAVHIQKIRPGDAFALCFIPHHFFRYFDKAGREIETISVCFCCAGVRVRQAASLKLGTDELLAMNYKDMERLVEELGVSTLINCPPRSKD